MSAATVLGHLAMDGIAPEKIARTIRSHLLQVYNQEYEDFEYYLPTLGRLCTGCPIIRDTVQAFFDTSYDPSDPIGKFEDLSELAAACPEFVEKNSPFFEEMMMDRGPSSRREFMSVYEPDRPTIGIEGKDFPLSPDSHAINAALLLHRRYPERSDISAALDFWEKHHADQNFRSMVRRKQGHDSASAQLPTWDQLKYTFVDDGSLMDLNIENVSEELYPRLLEFLSKNVDRLTFSDTEREYRLPATLKEWEHLQQSGALLRADLGKIDFICRLWGNDVEIDFRPGTVSGQNFEVFLQFVTGAGRSVSRDVALSGEGPSDKPFLVYDYHLDTLWAIPERLVAGERLSSEELRELDQRDR